MANWITILFALLAVGASMVIGWSANEFGYLTLLIIPAIILVLFSITWPGVGIMVLVFITFTQMSNVLIKFHGLPSIAQPLTALLLAVVIVRLFLFGDSGEGWTKVTGRLGLYGLVGLASVLVASNFNAASVQFLDYLKNALSVIIIVILLRNPARLRLAIWALIAAGLLMGSITVYQYLTGTFQNIYWGFGNWTAEVAGEVTRSRISGPFANPNAYAQTLVVIVPLALSMVWHERNPLLRTLAGLTLAVCVMSVFFSYSRGGLLSLIVALTVLLVERRPNILPLLITLGIGILLLRFLPSTYSDRISTLLEFIPGSSSQIYDSSFRGRISENQVGYMIFRDHPLLGVGLDNYPDQYLTYSSRLGIDSRRVARSPASLYLEILAEQGIIGVLVFAYLLWSVAGGLLQAKRYFLQANHLPGAWMSGALLASLIGYLFSALFKNSAYSNAFWALIGISMAAAIVAYETYLANYKDQEKARFEEELYR